MINKIDKYFKVSERNSTLSKELIGGLVAFLSMSYIIFVNPQILSQAGMDPDAVFVATILSSAVATIFMGIYANYPLGLAPCMSMNAFFSFSVVLGSGYTWQQALSIVLLSGILFVMLSLTKWRMKIINAIPEVIKVSATVGLGLFIAFVGLKNAGIIIADPNNILTFGKFSNPNVVIAFVGIIVTSLFVVRKSNFGVIYGMIASALTGLLIHALALHGVISLGDDVISTLPQLPDTFLVNPLDLLNNMSNKTLFVSIYTLPQVLSLNALMLVLTFVFLDFFGTAATLEAATSRTKKAIKTDDSNKIYLADSVGTTVGAILGTSNVTTYIESVSGVVMGGRTGLMSLVVGILFILSIFLYPLLSIITGAVTTPALIIVGVYMITNVKHINWDIGLEEIIPVFLIILFMPLSGSITLGLSIGFVMYTLLLIFVGRKRDISITMYIITIIAFLYLISVLV
ncbi:MAG: NCS2 family permease [Mycoplasmatales bacterium]